MTSREVDDVEGFELRDSGEHGMSFSSHLQDRRAWDRAAHQGGRDGVAGVVGELDGLAKHRAGLGDGLGAETLQDLGAQPVQARLLAEVVERWKQKLPLLLWEVWGEGASGDHRPGVDPHCPVDRKSTRLNSSHVSISYAVFCLKKKKQ